MAGKTKDLDVAEAKRLKETMSWNALAEHYGLSPQTVRRKIDPIYRERSYQPRTNHYASREIVDAVPSIPVIDTRTVQQRFFGDPHPGRSAWDQMPKAQREKYDGR